MFYSHSHSIHTSNPKGKYIGSWENEDDNQRKNRTVAIKIIEDNVTHTEVTNETVCMRELCHENIVKLIATQSHEGTLYIAMELCEYTLNDELEMIKSTNSAARGLLEWKVLKLLLGIQMGYKYMRDQDWNHSDIKPHNILYGQNGHYKLADFGFAQRLYGRTSVPCFGGTYNYAHPLVFKRLYWRSIFPGKAHRYENIPVNTDFWSIAAVLFQSVTCNVPYDASSDASMYQLIKFKGERDVFGREVNGEFMLGTTIPNQNLHPEFINDLSGILQQMMEVCSQKFFSLFSSC